ncbi:dTDP-4-dehydrorhamnose reductase [Luminiphilus sp.]|nr:dTDP-4-dehydrorhamnose reductase [Luminiphilus sp.]
MKILIIGADGQVGSEIRSQPSLQMSLAGQQLALTFSSRSDLDLRDLSAISEYLDRLAPNIIINASAYTAVDEAETNKHLAFLINEAAVKEMALFCKRSSCCLIHLSTDYVFDGLSDRPYLESDTVAPSTVYGSSKLAGEQAIREVLDQHIILRTSWVFGVNGGNFVKTMLRLVGGKGELGIVADQYGAPTSARAIAAMVAEIVSQVASITSSDYRWGTYHYSGMPYVSWADFAHEIFEQAAGIGLIDKKPKVNPILTSEYPTLANRPANSRLDCSKLKRVFDIKPDDWKHSLSLMLDELMDGM